MASKKRPPKPFKSSLEKKAYDDEILRELYAQRDAYCAKFGYDLKRIAADMNKRGAESRLRRAKATPKV